MKRLDKGREEKRREGVMVIAAPGAVLPENKQLILLKNVQYITNIRDLIDGAICSLNYLTCRPYLW